MLAIAGDGLAYVASSFIIINIKKKEDLHTEQLGRPTNIMEFEKTWPECSLSSGKQLTNTSVVIVGGGIGGMCVAIDLIKRNNCRDFVILERASGVGGTW